MFRKGLGSDSTFSDYHPACNLIYFAFVIGIAMFSNRPCFVTASFLAAFMYSTLLGGIKQIKMNLLLSIPVTVLMTCINALFTHNGATVLFYINGGRITLEAIVFGLAASGILISVVIWFTCFGKTISADKLIYIFGKAVPVIGLTLSMIFRFIPLLKERYREIRMGQKAMGRNKGFRQTMKELSILVSWSLEASIETADSMESRGYGLKGRSSFHLFRITRRDRVFMAFTLLAGGLSSAACIMGRTDIYYYPEIRGGNMDMFTYLSFAAYIILMLLPAAIDIYGERKWQK